MEALVVRENPTKDKILSFLELTPKWHFGEGVPPSKEIAKSALVVADRAALSGFDTDAFPGIDGEIMVTVYHDENYLEFTIETNQSVTFVHEKDNEEISYKENISFDEAIEKLDNFGSQIWKNTLESCIKTILIPEKTDLRALRFVTPPGQESPSFLEVVSDLPGRIYADISATTITKFPQFQPFSGFSLLGYYP